MNWFEKEKKEWADMSKNKKWSLITGLVAVAIAGILVASMVFTTEQLLVYIDTDELPDGMIPAVVVKAIIDDMYFNSLLMWTISILFVLGFMGMIGTMSGDQGRRVKRGEQKNV